MTDLDWNNLDFEVGRVFTPASPIDQRDLFSGRIAQVRRLIDAISQKGQHAILYGERGVGKTSLANMLEPFLTEGHGDESGTIAPRVNCDTTDTFDTVWRKVLEDVTVSEDRAKIGFSPIRAREDRPATDFLGEVATPDSVRKTLAYLSRMSETIVIIDEFDRLPDPVKHAFADTIKNLSDHDVGATVILVGVADSVDRLIGEHESISRALVMVPLQRMSATEISSIAAKGAKKLGMVVDDDATAIIASLSQGLPHYAHLLCLHAARAAIERRQLTIDSSALNVAIRAAVESVDQSIRRPYDLAIRSPRKVNLYADVLLACALAPADPSGYFALQDIRTPLRKLTGKKEMDIPNYSQHMAEFSTNRAILHKDGERYKYRYRFSNPLMRPFVVLKGITDGKMKENDITWVSSSV